MFQNRSHYKKCPRRSIKRNRAINFEYFCKQAPMNNLNGR